MDRILIDEDVLRCAGIYETAFQAKGLNVPMRLRDIKDKLDSYNKYNRLSIDELSQYKNYLEEIACDYNNADKTKNLLVLKPDQFQSYINKYEGVNYSLVDLKRSLVYKVGGKNTQKKKKFWELVVDAMGYDKCVRPIMIPLIEKIGIKTCVYCNLQYALTINHSQGLYELDHRYPKSKYPYFCTTFYNLQPSCPTCNHSKKAGIAGFGLYTKNKNEIHPFHLLTTPQTYLKKRKLNIDKIDIRLIASDTKNPAMCALANSHEKTFQINDTYRVVKDVAEETIWRCKAYDSTYQELFLRNFPELYDKDALHRFIFGVYSNDSNVHRRPLTKLVRDIMQDMGVMISI